MTPKGLLLPTLLALGLASGAAAQTLTTSYAGFDDVDGNGSLSCDEPVTIKVVYTTDSADPTELHATVLTPDSNTRGVTAFQTGSVAVDPDGTAGCTATPAGPSSPSPISRSTIRPYRNLLTPRQPSCPAARPDPATS